MAEMITKTCRQCNKEFETERPKVLLCDACRKENHAVDCRRKYEKGAVPDSPKLVQPELDRSSALQLDRRQFHHDVQLDARLYSDCSTGPVKVIKPGDAEFEAIAQTVTPLSKIAHREYGLYPTQYLILENGGFKRA